MKSKKVDQTSMMLQRLLPSGETLLTASAMEGIIYAMERLLPTATESDINGLNRIGSSALHMAVKKGQTKIVQLLLEHQASTELSCRLGYSALHLACLCGHLEIVEMLLKHGCCPNGSRHPEVPSPMIVAMGISNDISKDIVLLLMRHGADMNLRQNFGNNAFSKAVASGDVPLVKAMMSIATPDFAHRNVSGYNVFHGIFFPLLGPSSDKKRCHCKMLKILTEYVNENKGHEEAVQKALTEVMPDCIRSGCLTCFHTVLPYIDVVSEGAYILQHAMTPDENWSPHGPTCKWTYTGNVIRALNGHWKDMATALLESGASLSSIEQNVIGTSLLREAPPCMLEWYVLYIRAWGVWYSHHPDSAQIFRKLIYNGNMDDAAVLVCWAGYIPSKENLETIENERKDSGSNLADWLTMTFTSNPRPLLNSVVIFIRRRLCDNVFYRASLLNLPKVLEDHITLKPIIRI